MSLFINFGMRRPKLPKKTFESILDFRSSLFSIRNIVNIPDVLSFYHLNHAFRQGMVVADHGFWGSAVIFIRTGRLKEGPERQLGEMCQSVKRWPEAEQVRNDRICR